MFCIFSPAQLEDYSVQVSNLSRSEIIDGLGAMVDGRQGDNKLRNSLAKKYKMKHPIHQKLETLAKTELYHLCINLSIDVKGKDQKRKKKAISDYFFREYPDAPMTNLIKVMEEDAYFAELTTGIIFHIFVEGLFKTN